MSYYWQPFVLISSGRILEDVLQPSCFALARATNTSNIAAWLRESAFANSFRSSIVFCESAKLVRILAIVCVVTVLYLYVHHSYHKVMSNKSKTHCLRGHEFTPANTHVRATGFRTCKACLIIRQRGYKAGAASMAYQTPEQCFWAKVAIFPNLGPDGECWEWKGALSKSGYGQTRINGAQIRAHRYAYAAFNGPIPEGLFVMHSCDNRKCVNPAHLSTGTHTDNMRDCAAKGRTKEQKKTHCVKGHEFTSDNTIIRGGQASGVRQCRTCQHIAKKKRNITQTQN